MFCKTEISNLVLTTTDSCNLYYYVWICNKSQLLPWIPYILNNSLLNKFLINKTFNTRSHNFHNPSFSYYIFFLPMNLKANQKLWSPFLRNIFINHTDLEPVWICTQWTQIHWFTIESTSNLLLESPSIFHWLWKANPRGNDDIDSSNYYYYFHFCSQ